MSLKPSNRLKRFGNIYIVIIVLISMLIIINSILRNTSIFYRKEITLPFSLHLNKQDLVMVKGEEFRLFVYGINKRVSYSSTNFRVAGVNFNGRVFAYQTGKTYIIARVDGKKLKCRVRVIDLNKSRLQLKTGSTYQLKVKGISSISTWSSSNPSVATVNPFGKITAKKKGRATITVKVKGKVLKCVVNVT